MSGETVTVDDLKSDERIDELASLLNIVHELSPLPSRYDFLGDIRAKKHERDLLTGIRVLIYGTIAELYVEAIKVAGDRLTVCLPHFALSYLSKTDSKLHISTSLASALMHDPLWDIAMVTLKAGLSKPQLKRFIDQSLKAPNPLAIIQIAAYQACIFYQQFILCRCDMRHHLAIRNDEQASKSRQLSDKFLQRTLDALHAFEGMFSKEEFLGHGYLESFKNSIKYIQSLPKRINDPLVTPTTPRPAIVVYPYGVLGGHKMAVAPTNYP